VTSTDTFHSIYVTRYPVKIIILFLPNHTISSLSQKSTTLPYSFAKPDDTINAHWGFQDKNPLVIVSLDFK